MGGLVSEIQELTTRKERIEADIRKSLREREEMELNVESAAVLDTLSAQQKDKLDSAIEEKRIELDSLASEIANFQEKYAKFATMEAVDEEIKGLERDKERAQGRLNEMNSQVEDVATKLRGSNEQLTTRLLELKPHVDALSGIAPKPQSESINYNVAVKSFDSSRADDDIREELIDGVLEALKLSW